MPLPDRELLRLHVEAVWGIDLPAPEGDVIELLASGATPPWSLYLARLATETLCIWRPDVARAARAALVARAAEALALPSATPLPGITREVALRLDEQPAAMPRGAERTRLLSLSDAHDRALLRAFWPQEATWLPAWSPLVGVVEDGRLVSLAHSSRRTSEACELGIETAPEARQRGHALAVTRRWSTLIAAEGLVPIYSALAENTASLRLGAAAGYRPFVRAAQI